MEPKTYSDDPTAIAPCKTRKGVVYPDLVNNVPSRFVSPEEAAARGWPTFYQAKACRHSHQAARFTKSPDYCTDCWRTSKGKPPVYPKATNQTFYKPREKSATDAPLVVDQKPLEPTPADKRFLEALAECRDFDAAADAVGMTLAQVHTRLAYNVLFKQAVTDLQDRLQIRHILPASSAFEWDDEKRARFIEKYVDSGSLADARDAVGCTPSQYFAERKLNSKFSGLIEEAEPLAAKALEDIATQLALRGQDKLLIKLLAAKIPNEYSERIKIDVNDSSRLTDEQLNNQIRKLYMDAAFQKRLVELRSQVVDAEFTDAPALPANKIFNDDLI